jgi:pimeloyl-ACP methyl ester carboxylesterase
VRANLETRHRRLKTRRFLANQLDPSNNNCTMRVLEKLRAFDRPTMIVWGEADPHFDPDWGRRLYDVIPGAIRLEMLPNTGQLVMEEKPEHLVELLQEFLRDPSPSAAGRPGERSIDAPPALPQPSNTRTTP